MWLVIWAKLSEDLAIEFVLEDATMGRTLTGQTSATFLTVPQVKWFQFPNIYSVWVNARAWTHDIRMTGMKSKPFQVLI